MEGRINEPAKPPLPIAPNLPFQALGGGSQTSNLMSESGEGFITPSARQKGALIATGTGGSAPTKLEGGDTVVAPTIVAGPKVLPARSLQSDAAATPALAARTPTAMLRK